MYTLYNKIETLNYYKMEEHVGSRTVALITGGPALVISHFITFSFFVVLLILFNNTLICGMSIVGCETIRSNFGRSSPLPRVEVGPTTKRRVTHTLLVG